MVVTVVAYFAAMPFLGPIRATGVLGLLGFLGLTPILFRQKKGNVEFDERDETIGRLAWSRSALLAGLLMSLVAFVVWLVLILQGDETIGIGILPVLIGVHGLTLYIARSILVLIFSRTSVSNAEG